MCSFWQGQAEGGSRCKQGAIFKPAIVRSLAQNGKTGGRRKNASYIRRVRLDSGIGEFPQMAIAANKQTAIREGGGAEDGFLQFDFTDNFSFLRSNINTLP